MAARVRDLEIEGVHLDQEARRFYPNRRLASHLLGFANIDGQGIEGLELAFEERLRGESRPVAAIRDRRGRVVYSEQLLDDRAAHGDDMVLTIDKTLQHIAERELELAIRTYEAQAGSVVMMDPRTGELLAVANFPDFDANDPGDSPASHRRNRAFTDRFEPGSTVKPFTVAAALAQGTVGSQQLIDCEDGAMEVAEYTIHDTTPYDELTPAQILAFSSNIGTAKIGTSLGRRGLYRAFRRFGFGEITGVPSPGEAGGSLRHHSRWYEMDAATISFGQGMSTTAVQLATAMGALANGGRLMHPRLIRRVQTHDGEILEEFLPEARRQVVPARVARLVADMLTAVTGPGGTGQPAAIDGFLVAGKTGTAQKADYVAGGYAEDRWLASFVGFVPANDPQIVMAVIVDEPVVAHYGGTVAGPVFRRVGEAALRHLGVPRRWRRRGARSPRSRAAAPAPAQRAHRPGRGRRAHAGDHAHRPGGRGGGARPRRSHGAGGAGRGPRSRTAGPARGHGAGGVAGPARRRGGAARVPRARRPPRGASGPRAGEPAPAGRRADRGRGGRHVMLQAIADRTGARLHLPEGTCDVAVRGVQHDSRAIAAGDLFAAIEGASFDGTRFASGAVERGAVAVLASRELPLPVPQLISGDVRHAMAVAAHAVEGDPTRDLELVGITGTNGKTTTSYLVDGMLRELGRSPWMLGTVEVRAGEARRPARFTTPEADDLARFAREAVDAGAGQLVMEVSSHGLAQARVAGAHFAVAAFTNLSRDHLDFHGTMEAYEAAKASLFLAHRPRVSVLNVDDPAGARIAAAVPDAITVGRSEDARLRIVDARFERTGIQASLTFDGAPLSLGSALVGRHNLENLAAALGCGLGLGLPSAEAAAALGRAPAAPGRLEPVADPRGSTIVVDYAHTPDALVNALRALRPITAGRLVVVFGCGGDRDAGKRPQMGRAAAEGADLVIVTSDNPRTEDPAAIVEAIVPGVEAAGLRLADVDAERGFVVEIDRARAIARAVAALRPEDTLLVAGKGHEDYQIVGTAKRPFDDRAVAAEAIASVAGESP